jgi:hypothetical protein
MRSLRVNVALLRRNDYNLSPSGYVATNEQEGVVPLEEVGCSCVRLKKRALVLTRHWRRCLDGCA